MARLQIGIELNTDADPEMDIRVTPADIEVPDHIAAAARTLISYFDASDVHPGDGEADIKLPRRLPINLGFIRTQISIDGNVFLRIRD
jgi:hypothetical protein